MKGRYENASVEIARWGAGVWLSIRSEDSIGKGIYLSLDDAKDVAGMLQRAVASDLRRIRDVPWSEDREHAARGADTPRDAPHPAMNEISIPVEDNVVKHISARGYECGGPHYRPPDASRWAWCEPVGEWFAVADAAELTDELGNVINADLIDMTADGENVILLKNVMYSLWSPRVAVVRPTLDRVALCIASVFNEITPDEEPEPPTPMDYRRADAVLALFGVAVSDSQPVRPTRDQVADMLAPHIERARFSPMTILEAALDTADAVLALFGVAVSDSQETPK